MRDSDFFERDRSGIDDESLCLRVKKWDETQKKPTDSGL